MRSEFQIWHQDMKYDFKISDMTSRYEIWHHDFISDIRESDMTSENQIWHALKGIMLLYKTIYGKYFQCFISAILGNYKIFLGL